MSLLKDADFCVFDEPLASVDPESKDRVIEAILAGTEGKGLLVVLHGDDQYRPRFDREVSLAG